MDKNASWIPALGRLLMSVIFLLSGLQKLGTHEATVGYIASQGLPFPDIAYFVAVAVELGGGVLLLVGYQARFAAAVLAVFCIATAFGFHNDFGNQGQMINFLKNITITGGLLQVVAFGAGTLSLDHRRLMTT